LQQSHLCPNRHKQGLRTHLGGICDTTKIVNDGLLKLQDTMDIDAKLSDPELIFDISLLKGKNM